MARDVRKAFLAVCPECSFKLRFAHIIAYADVDDGKLFRSVCPKCAYPSQVHYTQQQLDKLRNQFVPPEEVRQSVLSSEEIGRLVAGFRIDLDSIETVDDVVAEWASYGSPAPREEIPFG